MKSTRQAQASNVEQGRLMPISLVVTRAFVGLLSSIVLLVWQSPACAGNLSFLKDTPITYMKQPDREAINKSARTALDTKRDGESLNWSNAGTGNPVTIKGTITPRDSVKDGERTCRKLTIIAVAKGQTETWRPTACRTGKGAWEVQKR
jgi:surface antigen